MVPTTAVGGAGSGIRTCLQTGNSWWLVLGDGGRANESPDQVLSWAPIRRMHLKCVEDQRQIGSTLTTNDVAADFATFLLCSLVGCLGRIVVVYFVCLLLFMLLFVCFCEVLFCFLFFTCCF